MASAEVRAQIFPFELRPSTADDELLAVARAADVNLFMDATDVPETIAQVSTPFPGRHDWALENILMDIGPGRRLAWEIEQQDRALLFSAQPDLKQLGRKMLQGPGIEVAVAKLDEAAFQARLIDYLRRQQGWKGDGTPWSKTLPIAELPADLKHEVLARTQSGALNDSLSGALMMRELLSDETWKQARLFIGSQKVAGGPDAAALLLVMKTPSGVTTRVLSPLPQPKPENRS